MVSRSFSERGRVWLISSASLARLRLVLVSSSGSTLHNFTVLGVALGPDSFVLRRHAPILAAGEGQAADQNSEDGHSHLCQEVQNRARPDFLHHVTLLLEVFLADVLHTSVAVDARKLILKVARVVLEVSLGREVDDAHGAGFTLSADLGEAVGITSTRVQNDILAHAGRASETRFPDEVKDALVSAHVVLSTDKLGEVLDVLVALRITHVLNMALVVAHWVHQAGITLVIDDLESRPLRVVEGAHIDDAAAQVLEHFEILNVLHLGDWVVGVGAPVGVRVENVVPMNVLKCDLLLSLKLGHEEGENETFLWLFRA